MVLNTLEKARLMRKIAVNKDRIDELEKMLRGQSLNTARFADLIITAAKILNISADKITSGTMAVGEQILVSDEVTNRILIDRTQILISKPGVEVTDTITEANKKDFVLLSTVDAHKIVTATTFTGSSYAHGLTKVPFYLLYEVDDPDTPTVFTPTLGRANATNILPGFSSDWYVVIFNEGGNP